MGLFNKNENANKPVKTPEVVFNAARSNLLLVVVFSAVNVILRLVSADMYFLFSASTPMAFLDIATLTEIPELMPVAAVLAFIVIGVYLLCWALSKKHPGWLVAALVLFVLDTLVLVGLYDLSAMIIDLAMHAWVLYYLVTGTIALKKMKNQPAEMLPVPEGDPVYTEMPPVTLVEPVYPETPYAVPEQTAEPQAPQVSPVMVNGEPIQDQ